MIKKKIVLSIYRKSEEILKRKSELLKFRFIRAYRRRLINYVVSHYKSNYIEIEGRKMFLDANDSLRLSLREYSPLATHLVKSEVKRGDVVIDLGANIGYWTLFFAQLVGENGRVFAFEPEPSNFKILEKNVRINGYQNVVLIQKAASSITGRAKLYLSYESTDNRIYDTHDNRDFINIETITLDEYFRTFDREINFIKSNIQGADFAAIQGMSSLLKKSKNIKIMTEFSPYLLKPFNAEPEEFLKTLTDEGFNLYDINSVDNKIYSTTVNELLKKYPSEKNKGTYLYCTKWELN